MRKVDRERFETFLKIAAESPFPGERANALDAARRVADRHGLTLDQARRAPPRRRPAAARPPAPSFEAHLEAERARYESALREAVSRRLDGEPRPAAGKRNQLRPQAALYRRRRNPLSFARVLIAETSLPLTEIVSLTGLDIYRVAGMKLKMRAPG